MLKSIVRSMLPKETLKRLRSQFEDWRFRLRVYKNRPNLYTFGTDERGGIIYLADTHLTIDERQVLYALVRGLRPRRVLEIGSLYGGSASIICSAMEDNGTVGRLVGIDPVNNLSTPKNRYFGRFQLLELYSPQGIPEARALAGGAFDFAHLDGINIYEQAIQDLEGAYAVLAQEAYILINNPLHRGVHLAVKEFLEKHDDMLDCGFLSKSPTLDPPPSPQLAYGGLRLLRRFASTIADPQLIIEDFYGEANIIAPVSNDELMNHDVWYCDHVKACPWCERSKG